MEAVGTVQVPNALGTACCDCSVQLGCSCSPVCSVVCQARSSASGNASFCGFPEYTNPHNPPLFYRTMQLNGSSTADCGGPSCSPATPAATITYSGQNSYDKTTCVYTQNGNLLNSVSGNFSRSDIQANDLADMVSGVGFNVSDGYTQTEHYLIMNSSGCVLSGSGFTGCIPPPASGINAVLSDQDQLADAVARAVVGRAWGGTDCQSNYSFATANAPGSKIFAFQEAQAQVTYFGVPGTNHTLLVNLYQRPHGTTDPWVEVGGLIFDITVPPGGNAVSAWQTLPFQAGLDIMASGCTVVS